MDYLPTNFWSLSPEYNVTLPYRYEIKRDLSSELVISCRAERQTTLHFHDCLEFMYVAKGTMEAVFDDHTETVTPGHMMVSSSFSPHGCFAQDAETWMVIIPRTRINAIDQLMDGKSFCRRIIADEDSRLLHLIRLTAAILYREDSFAGMEEAAWEELCTSSVVTLVRLVIALSGLTEKSGDSALMLRTIQYINRHFREPLRVTDLTRQLLCSQCTLSAQFRSTFGMTITEYINRVRAAEVRALLTQHPDMSLSEAAERAGFGSLRSLHRAYQAVYGHTPRGE